MDILPLIGALLGIPSLPDVREITLPAWREKSFSGENN
jgi:hypothetical protein